MASSAQNQPKHHDFDVVIVGAGIAGCSAAYHLQQQQKQSSSTSSSVMPSLLILDAADQAGVGTAPRHSGSATMDTTVAPCVKMMVQVFAGNTQEFVAHHGHEGARRYLMAAEQGLQLQKNIAQEIWGAKDGGKGSSSQIEEHMKELGSYYVTDKSREKELKEEYEQLKSLGGKCCEDLEWCDKDRIMAVEGMSSDFDCGIYFPKDAIIDSSFYTKTLLQYTLDQYNSSHPAAAAGTNSDDKAQFWASSKVTNVEEHLATTDNSFDYPVLLELESGVQIRAKHVIMATGGLYQNIPHLNGLLRPCYSYLVHVPVNDQQQAASTTTPTTTTNNKCDFSANFFTWGFSHDWCFTKGKIRCSGEDHFSAYKPPKLHERCANLSQWTHERYHHDDTPSSSVETLVERWKDIPQQYGVYSETPDMAPLIGQLTKESRICYLLGCNAWGQTILSHCASLVPGLLGLRDLSDNEKESLKLVSIRRFTDLPKTQ